jgi:hypothetical protein
VTQKSCWKALTLVIDIVEMQTRPQGDPLLKDPSAAIPALPPGTTQQTLAIIMGGGAGTRLFPLTKDRAKPAVPLGGKYRIVDIPISNCLNSGLRSIYVLTQFNSMSLHRHIQASYKFDNFSRSFVDILAAQQTPAGSQWYQGTADAVRQNMRYFLERPFDYYLILSGDQLYRMDFRALLHQHIRSGADITLATKPIHRQQVSEFGIMQAESIAGLGALSRNRLRRLYLTKCESAGNCWARSGRTKKRSCTRLQWEFTSSIGRCSSNVWKTIWSISEKTSFPTPSKIDM